MNQDKIKEMEMAIGRDYGNTAGIVVQQNGRTVYENHFNGYTVGDAFHVFSVTKSILSVLIGIAIDNGHIKSINQKVLDFFPNYRVQEGEHAIQHITIKDMLTMTAPYKFEAEPYQAFFSNDDWVKAALDLLGGEGPIGEFRYTALVGPDILSGILTNATGQSVLDFAAKNLFLPLGIEVPRAVVLLSEEEHIAWSMKDKHDTSSWVVDSQGVNTAGWGFTMKPLDMAKVGQLYLDGGKWNGQQIVSAKWIDESTIEHSRWAELSLSYGYLWWVIDKDEHAYAAMGDGGNVIYVNTKKQLVVAIACLFMPEAKNRIELIRKCIEPIFEACE